jgi:hypothetical protein
LPLNLPLPQALICLLWRVDFGRIVITLSGIHKLRTVQLFKIIYSLSSAFGDKLSGLSVPFFCSSLRDYFGLIFDELFTVFDSRGEFSRLNVFFISTVKKLLQEV